MAPRSGAYFAFARPPGRSEASGLYSPFVRAAKIALPAAAAALLLTVFAWPEAEDVLPAEWNEGASAQFAMTNVEAFGWDEDRPYSVRSAGARRLGVEGQRFLMDRPRAWLVLPDGAWLSGSGESGIVDWTMRTVRFSGEVQIRHETGYAIRTGEALVNLADRTAAGDRPVEGDGNDGWFRAQGFRVLDGGNRIQLIGRSTIRFEPKAAVQ